MKSVESRWFEWKQVNNHNNHQTKWIKGASHTANACAGAALRPESTRLCQLAILPFPQRPWMPSRKKYRNKTPKESKSGTV